MTGAAAAARFIAASQRMPPAVTCAVLVMCFVSQLVLAVVAARAHAGFPAAPVPALDWMRATGAFAHDPARTVVLLETVWWLLALCETAALLALTHARASRAIWAGGVVMTAAAVCCPVLESSDLYAYMGYGLLGFDAYHPPAERFAGAFSVISDYWGVPMVPAPYGPVWIGLLSALHAAFVTPAAGIVVLRGVAALGVVILAALVGRVHEILARLVLLNPFFMWSFTMDGHNDILGIDAIVAALLVVRRSRVAAVVLIAAAASIKITLLAAAVPITVVLGRLRDRVGVVAGGLLLTVAALSPFAHAFRASLEHHAREHGPAIAAHAVVYPIAAGVLIAAWLFRFTRSGAGWFISGAGAAWLPSYFSWSMPYALVDRKTTTLVACLPLIAASTDAVAVNGATLVCGIVIVTAVTLLPLERPEASAAPRSASENRHALA